jgi:hypothetical protein
MTRHTCRRFLTTFLPAFAGFLILIPAASAMPLLSDPAAAATPTTPLPFVSPFGAVFHATPAENAQTGDGWYPAAVHRPGPVLGVDLSVPNPGTVPTLSAPDSGHDWQPFGLMLGLSVVLAGLLAVASRRSAQPRHVPLLH